MQPTSFLSARFPLTSNKTALHSLIQTMRGTKAFFDLLFDESGSLAPVWELSNSLVDSPAFQLAVASLKTMPEVADLLRERYIAPAHDLNALLHYPAGSLGYVYAHYMKQEGLYPIEPAIAIDSDTRYIENRWQQTHDIWHVITGFDTSAIGEIGLQAFYLAQFQLPLSSLLIANALISVTLFTPEIINPMLSAIARGWEMGKTAQPLIAQKWEEAWEKPVTAWRTELNVFPITR
jgi:ubiquinone biosynthesis protein COQ4